MSEKVKFGLSNVHIAPRTEAVGGAVTYGSPVAIPGAVQASITRNSDQNIFYADNKAYFVANRKSSQEIELELADLAKDILTGYLGYIKSKNGSLLETNMTVTPAFALLFQIETDEKARKICYYNCTATESDEEYDTQEESIDPTTSKITATCTGEKVGDFAVFREIAFSGDTNYDDFFKTVTVPASAEASKMSMDNPDKAVI